MKNIIKTIAIFSIFLTWLPCNSLASSETQKSLQNNKAIVWGASQGIGRAIAHDLAKKGAFTYIIARSEDKLISLSKEIEQMGGQSKYYVADITNEQEVFEVTDKILKEANHLDIMVQNVGIYPRKLVSEMDSSFFNHVLSTNLISSFNATKAVLPVMQKQQYGRIVLVSSITGPHTGIPGLAAYGASKAALQGFIRTAAIELGADNITINSVEPGYIKTEGLEYLGQEYFDKVNNSVPLGRMGDVDEIAHVVSFLASNESSYVTGTHIVIDGGLTLPESHHLHVLPKNQA